MEQEKLDKCHIEIFAGLEVWYRNVEDEFSVSKNKKI